MFNETETRNLLQAVAQELQVSYIPIIKFLVLFVLIGVPGNVVSAYYFGFKREKTSNNTFTMALAFTDLYVCGIIVVYIYELYGNISFFTTRFLCKASFCAFLGGIFLSISIVCAIAVDRYITMNMNSSDVMTLTCLHCEVEKASYLFLFANISCF